MQDVSVPSAVEEMGSISLSLLWEERRERGKGGREGKKRGSVVGGKEGSEERECGERKREEKRGIVVGAREGEGERKIGRVVGGERGEGGREGWREGREGW